MPSFQHRKWFGKCLPGSWCLVWDKETTQETAGLLQQRETEMFSLVPSSGQTVNTFCFASSCLRFLTKQPWARDSMAGIRFLFKETQLLHKVRPSGWKGEKKKAGGGGGARAHLLVYKEWVYILVFNLLSFNVKLKQTVTTTPDSLRPYRERHALPTEKLFLKHLNVITWKLKI